MPYGQEMKWAYSTATSDSNNCVDHYISQHKCVTDVTVQCHNL